MLGKVEKGICILYIPDEEKSRFKSEVQDLIQSVLESDQNMSAIQSELVQVSDAHDKSLRLLQISIEEVEDLKAQN